jgi:chromosome segregation ATPase
VLIIEARQQVPYPSPAALETDKESLRADAPTIQDLQDIAKQLSDTVASQRLELEKDAAIINQVKVDRDILKIELEALRVQRVERDQTREIINRLEAERDRLKNELDALLVQRIEWDKGKHLIKAVEKERDNLKTKIDSLKRRPSVTEKVELAKPETVGSGPVFLPLDDTQRAQFPNTETDEKDPRDDKKDQRAAS